MQSKLYFQVKTFERLIVLGLILWFGSIISTFLLLSIDIPEQNVCCIGVFVQILGSSIISLFSLLGTSNMTELNKNQKILFPFLLIIFSAITIITLAFFYLINLRI